MSFLNIDFKKVKDFIFSPKENKINNIEFADKTDERYITNYYVQDLISSVFDGDKFPGSFGITKDYAWVDYYLLRKRSIQLFKENSYIEGVLKRLITNEINTGLNLEANPLSQLLGITEDQAITWAEDVELKWNLWSRDNYICDFNQLKNLGQITADIRRTALISGDCLVILRINRITSLPCLEIIDGCDIQTPIGKTIREGNHIKYGIEFRDKKQVAYWIYVDNGNNMFDWERVPCWGEKSGRRIAWLVYGSDRLLSECRGQPLLSNAFYMMKDLDRYKDAEVRAAVLNAVIPLFVTKTEKTVGSSVFGQGAVRRDNETVVDGDIRTKNFNVSKMLPGTVIDDMPYGQKIESFDTRRPNINFGKFEEIILDVLAWTIELPPEILKLKFVSNYSASRQANNELQVYINKRAWLLGCEFLQNVYEEWVIAAVLNGKIKADGLVEAWFNNDWEKYNAWLNTEWSGLNRPSVDGLKDATTSETLLKLGLTNFDSESKRNTGKRWRPVVQKLAREKAYLKSIGIVSSVDEDTQGKPVEEGNNNKVMVALSDISERLNNLEAVK